MPITVKDVNKENYTLTMIASTQTVDRHGDTIIQAGWDLAPYKKNPVILNSHNYFDATEVIAKAKSTKIEGKGKKAKLVQVWEFAVEENPKAKIIFDLYAGGFLHASSVGFIPRKFAENKDGSRDWYTIEEAELLEVSAVSVPANAAATLAKSIGASVKDIEDAIGVEDEEDETEDVETGEEETEDETETEETPEEETETEDGDDEEEDDGAGEKDDEDDVEEEESEETETEEEETETPEPEPKTVHKPTRMEVTAKVINRLNKKEEATLKAVHATIGKMLKGEGIEKLDRNTGRKVQERNYNKVIRKLLKAK